MEDNIVSYPIEVSLRLLGVWPGSPNPTIRKVSWITLILSLQSFQYWNFVSHLEAKDTASLMGGFIFTVTDSVVLSRVLLLCLNTRAVHDVFGVMSEDWKEGKCSKWQFKMMTEKADLAHQFTKWSGIFYAFGTVFFGSGILCTEHRRQNGSDVSSEHVLLKTYFPIEGEYSPVKEFLIIEQFVLQVVFVLHTCLATSLMVTLTLHVDGQIELIEKQLTEITSTKEKPGYVRTCLKMVIRRHQKVIDFCANIEQIFTYMAFLVFLIIALLFGCIWFILSVSNDVLIQMMFVVYYMCTLLDVFIYCQIGEHLRDKSLAVGQAVYRSVWYHFNSAECQVLLLLLLRSQRRLTITVGKFVDLSMELFATTLKTSVSIVSLFLAMY